MKTFNKNFKLLLAGLLFLCCSTALRAQVNGFAINDPTWPTNHPAGSSFPINVAFNWTLGTTSATVTITFNPAVVTYNGGLTASGMLPCVALSNTVNTVTLTIANLSSCTNTNSLSVNVYFYFNCPSACAGVQLNTIFNGTITDNLATTQTDTAASNGMVSNSVQLLHSFYSYNSLTAEITFRVYFYNPGCFVINNPKFNVALSPALGTITSAVGFNYTYTVAGFTITPTAAIGNYGWDTMYYVVKLPCNTGNGQTLTSNITLFGDNCSVPNSNIKGPVPASFTIPMAPAALPNAALQMWSLSAPNRFRVRVTNTGNTPLNLTLTDFMPLVHGTSVLQGTNQFGISNNVVYKDCALSPTGPFPLVGNGASNASLPSNTKQVIYNVNNLLPGNFSYIDIYFDLTSSCSGPAGPAPYTDICSLTYNCNAPPVHCINCGNTTGTAQDTVIYSPQPILQCQNSTYISTCKKVGDTLDICFEFKNIGDAPLTGGVLFSQLPGWLQLIPGSEVFTNFSSTPTYVPSTSAKWNMPTLPVGNTIYKVCYKVIIGAGATGGTNGYWTTATGSNINYALYVCWNSFNICAYAAIGIDKKVKGSLDPGYGTSGTGIPGSMVDYQITLYNTGTIPINNLEVIDRFPALLDNFILTNPTCPAARGSQFNMLPGPLPVVPSCTVTSSNNPNVCTGWTGVCTVCGPPAIGNWSGGNKAYRFLFNTAVTIAPGGSQTFNFQLQIPNGTSAGLHACNTAGFNATTTSGGYTINPVESPSVCVEVQSLEVPPGGCCKDLLKKIKETHKVDNDILTINLTLSAGPNKMKKVTVSLVNFEVRHPKDCDICTKDPKYFGNIVLGNNAMPWSTAPANLPFSHLVGWKDSVGVNWSNGMPLNFTIPLPPRSPIACCCDTIYYCLRYTFTDTACVTCDTTICYKAYNGKDCKDNSSGGNDNPICNCNFKPVIQYESNGAMGTKDVKCGDVITLFAGNIFTSMLPNFECKDQTGKDCDKGNMTVVIKKPDNTTQVLTGPSYNFTYTLPGTYEYTISATCAGKKCDCSFRVIIPAHQP